jgi:competence protein ComEC
MAVMLVAVWTVGRLSPNWAVALGVATAFGLAGWHGAAASSALNEPVPTAVSGRVTLTTDPRTVGRVVSVEVRHGSRLYDATAAGGAAGELVRLRAGESVRVAGSVRPTASDDLWRRSRHVVGRISLTEVAAPAAASGLGALANGVHRAVQRVTSHLPRDNASVVLGVALGDRGAITQELAGDLRAAGLSHLTAASGQHVVLLMAMVSPLLGRLPRWWGLAGGVAVLGGFVVLTRGEPSVLRAGAMGLIVVASGALARPVKGLGALALAVTGLVIVDPLIVDALGFQLSVLATAGIALFARRIAMAIPGPRPVREAIGVTLAAQFAVAPLLVWAFGSMPAIGLATNLLVAPFIGPLMGWTLVAGTLGGLVPAFGFAASLPMHLMAGWVAVVARWGAAAPLSGIDAREATACGLAVLVVALGWRWRRRLVIGVGVAALGCSLLWGVTASLPIAPGVHDVGSGAVLVAGRGRALLVVDGRAQAGVVADRLRQLELRHIDAVVVRTGSQTAFGVAELVCGSRPPCQTLAPTAQGSGPRTMVVEQDVSMALGDQMVHLVVEGGVLVVRIRGTSDSEELLVL